jgi:hypothetical protein
MIVNNLNQVNKDFFHTIIIGSGPAGISAALEFEKKKIKCLVIEAGPENGFIMSKLQYKGIAGNELEFLKGTVIGDKYNDLSVTRLRQFGGTSGHWGGTCNLFLKHTLKDWPIEFNEFNKFLKEAKEVLDIKDSFYEQDFNFNFNQSSLLTSPVRFYDKFYSRIKNSKYIFLSTQTVFLEFIKGNGNKVKSIKCYKEEKFYNLEAKFFILSCGGIENSRMLLWSKKKTPSLFNINLPIGNYYMDHPWQEVGKGILNYKELKLYYKDNGIENRDVINCIPYPNIYFTLKKSYTEQNNILNTGLYLALRSEIDKNFLRQIECVAPKYIRTLFKNVNYKDIYQVELFLSQEQEPKLENRITLSGDLDPLGVPLVNLHWKKSELLRKTAKISTVDFANFLVTKNIGRLSISEYLFNKNDYETQVGYHQMGGTRIGYSEKDSVVDKNLRVHGIDNLFVNGSSIFRTSGHNHPTFTIVMLAIRLGKHITAL